MTKARFPVEGGCSCRFVRYRMTTNPMFVNCCHCTWCQRETGSAFVINAIIERDRITILGGEPEMTVTPSASGKGQKIMRCPKCRVAVWSHYAGAGLKVAFVRVGTLDHPELCPPGAHIFTSTKQPWVTLSGDAPICEEYYDSTAVWTVEAQERRAAVMAG